MIEIKTNEGRTNAKIHGDVVEITSDTIVMINTIHEALKKKSPEDGARFKNLFMFMSDCLWGDSEEMDKPITFIMNWRDLNET